MERDNETWIVETGDAVVRRRIEHGAAASSVMDRLIYCLWVADYGMRNAGDLDTASDLYAPFQDEAARLSVELALPVTRSAFTLSRPDLERRYFELFDDICNEIQAAQSRDFSQS
jgi:hypothetical protein